MLASNLFRDETELRQFLADVELDLREGRSQDAIERVDFALGVLEEFGHPIIDICRAYPPSAICIRGWDKLAARLADLDQPDRAITAISIDLSSHGDFHANSDDAIAPHVQTNFYSDAAFPFSTADRATISAGYGHSSSDWAGNFEEIDGTIEITGIGRLNFAIDALESEHRLESSDDPVVSDAMALAVTYRAVAIHHAVRTKIETEGLPRPLTILVGSHDSYPFFDSPVITANEYSKGILVHNDAGLTDDNIHEMSVDEIPDERQTAQYRVESEPVSILDPEENAPEPAEFDEWAVDDLEAGDKVPEIEPELHPVESVEVIRPAAQAPKPRLHLSGSEIRRRFAEPDIIMKPPPKSGLLNRLFSRS